MDSKHSLKSVTDKLISQSVSYRVVWVSTRRLRSPFYASSKTRRLKRPKKPTTLSLTPMTLPTPSQMMISSWNLTPLPTQRAKMTRCRRYPVVAAQSKRWSMHRAIRLRVVSTTPSERATRKASHALWSKRLHQLSSVSRTRPTRKRRVKTRFSRSAWSASLGSVDWHFSFF